MPRVLIAECKQEVSSFNPGSSDYADFRIVRGDDLLRHHRSVREEVGGALSVFDRRAEIELVPTFGASANTSGGVLTAAGFRKLASDFLTEIAKAGTVDAAYFSMHGAMQAEGELDPEGFLLTEARKILGDNIPFVLSLDLHGILTDRMLQQSDAVVAYHTYPHVDFFETGTRSAQVLLKILAGARPVTARIKIPALVRGDELITDTGHIKLPVDYAKQCESSGSALSAAMMWGNPFTDVPELCSCSVVTVDGDAQKAGNFASAIADLFWQHHEKMQVPLTSLEQSVQLAAQCKSGTVVFMDAADATSSGASGDSNAILWELRRQNYCGRVLAPIVDAEAVEVALAAGIGATIQVTLGGRVDTKRFRPLPVEAKVRMLSDGDFRSESFGWPWFAGPTAVLQIGNWTIVVGSRPVSLFDRSFFWAHGQEPQHFDLVVVKSPHCEHHMFSEWCALKVNVDAPGSTSANVRGLGHTVCARPMFPLDSHVNFQPRIDIFDRR